MNTPDDVLLILFLMEHPNVLHVPIQAPFAIA